MFENVDLDSLWYEGETFGKEDYECGNDVSDDLIESIEKDLGFKLPKSYIFLMKKHNGGILSKNCVHINTRKRYGMTKRYDDIEGIYGLGRGKRCSIYEANKEKEYFEENLIAICSSNSGHANVYLDYSICGASGEPRVIAIDNELMMDGINPKPLILADNFESFIKSLYEYDEDFVEDDNDVGFVPDDNIHNLVKKKILIKDNIGMYIFMLIILLLIIIGFVFNIRILKWLIILETFLCLGLIVSSEYILKRKYKCWYDELADIKEENGIKKYILKDTEIKMNFIIDKHDKINIGDKFLCVSEGFAFKYDNSKQ